MVVAVVVVVDQITKIVAIDTLKGEGRTEYLGGFFALQYAENPGAFLSMGAGMTPELRFLIFVLAVALFLVIVAYLLFVKTQPPLAAAVFALLLGGGIGNLIDRSFRENGHVIDFLNVGIGSLRTGIFNVADMAIVLALGFGILDFIYESKNKSNDSSKVDKHFASKATERLATKNSLTSEESFSSKGKRSSNPAGSDSPTKA